MTLIVVGQLNRHGADNFFYLSDVDHYDGVPGATVQEAAVRTFADAFLAADAQDGIDLNAAEGRMIFVGYPEHAVFHGAIFHARGRAGAPGAALRDHRKLFRFLLARRG